MSDKLTEHQTIHLMLEEQRKTNKMMEAKERRRKNWITFKLLFWSALILAVIVLIFIYAPAETGGG
jgi:hypothetical protein